MQITYVQRFEVLMFNTYSHNFIGIRNSSNKVTTWTQALCSIAYHVLCLWQALKAVVEWELATHKIEFHGWIFVPLPKSYLGVRNTISQGTISLQKYVPYVTSFATPQIYIFNFYKLKVVQKSVTNFLHATAVHVFRIFQIVSCPQHVGPWLGT